MYDELPLDPELPAEIQEAKRQYVLTAGEVARTLGISQQAVSQWTANGWLPSLAEKRGPQRATHRYSLAGIVDAARARKRRVRAYHLPIRLLQHYDIKPLIDNDDLVDHEPGPGEPGPSEWMSEVEASKLLNLRRTTLRSHRVQGMLNPAVRIRPGRRGGCEYSTESLLELLNGTIELYATITHRE